MISAQAFLDSLTLPVLLTGFAIFTARIVDVSCGAIRTISLVQGRMGLAFWAGFVEVVVWLIVLSNTLGRVMSTPALGVFYAFGFATGNVVGIWIERRIALGALAIRVFCSSAGHEVARLPSAWSAGGSRLFEGKGRDGAVTGTLCGLRTPRRRRHAGSSPQDRPQRLLYPRGGDAGRRPPSECPRSPHRALNRAGPSARFSGFRLAKQAFYATLTSPSPHSVALGILERSGAPRPP
ncbi:MAG: DUF5698 domain-containing protein [Kiritimatiellia bacterium]